MTQRPRRGCRPGVDSELVENVQHMRHCRAMADKQCLANLFVGIPFDKQTQHLDLPLGQPSRRGGVDRRYRRLAGSAAIASMTAIPSRAAA